MSCTIDRMSIEVRGVVQGVGFRPYVYSLATQLKLGGFVENRDGAVWIEVEGSPEALDDFYSLLVKRAPSLARIDSVERQQEKPGGSQSFHIRASSRSGAAPIVISTDVAVCRDCLAEFWDPRDRRYRYPLLTCSHCGPRLTIVTGAPYDREQTTMASFAMCAHCRAEYEDPHNRRFHAQAIACPACGPQLSLRNARGEIIVAGDPVKLFAEAIQKGQIGAMKGLGGYHLVCDAGNEAAVRLLRARKHRDEKPLAIMVRDLNAAEAICLINSMERLLLETPSAPIVLLSRRGGKEAWVAPSVAPGNPCLGVMLPYTPLHHLLLEAVAPLMLVMTSGNRADEPIAYEDHDALERLAGIADLFLAHDRPIRVRCDDSVLRVSGGVVAPLRRSRGMAPAPLSLPFSLPSPILAVGGHLKGSFTLGRDRQAFVSHHLGDLDHLDAYQALQRDAALYEELFAIQPKAVVHDLHPDYGSTRYAHSRGLPAIAVQHHHAHLASCMVEHGLSEPVIGVIFDGSGLGTDGNVWGGEFLLGGYAGFRRIASMRNVPLPGGERAIREPWRMAAAHLLDAGCGLQLLESLVQHESLRQVRAIIDRKIHTVLTSSMGRLFDAVAALVGIRQQVAYEGQAAMELEWAASMNPEWQTRGTFPPGIYDWQMLENDVSPDDPVSSPLWVIDTRPLIREIVADIEHGAAASVVARKFHSTLVEIISATCRRIGREFGLNQVVLSGGVFSNALLAAESQARLSEEGFVVFAHQQVPANDGGLSLGQLAVASHLLCCAHRE